VAVFEQKIGSSSAVKKYAPESCTKHFFQGNYMSETFGTITTLLAMVTKFCDSTSKREIINKTANIIYKNCNHFI